VNVPTVHPVEVVSSLVHRQGDQIRMVLHLPDAAAPSGAPVVVRFKDGTRRIKQKAVVRPADAGVVLEVTLPRRRLGRGIWSLAFRPGPGQPFERIAARLLTRARQPIALLPGPVPRTRLPEPLPAAGAPVQPEPRPLAPRVLERARRLARRVDVQQPLRHGRALLAQLRRGR
jgi:hypothetical protein